MPVVPKIGGGDFGLGGLMIRGDDVIKVGNADAAFRGDDGMDGVYRDTAVVVTTLVRTRGVFAGARGEGEGMTGTARLGVDNVGGRSRFMPVCASGEGKDTRGGDDDDGMSGKDRVTAVAVTLFVRTRGGGDDGCGTADGCGETAVGSTDAVEFR